MNLHLFELRRQNKGMYKMRNDYLFILMALLPIATISQEPAERDSTNNRETPSVTDSACDSFGFIEAAIEAEKLRKDRKLSAEKFAQFANEPNTIVLDARGATAFRSLHVKGSVNLPYTAFSQEALQRTIPDTTTRVLIYCRNNLTRVQIGHAYSSVAKTDVPILSTDLELAFAKGQRAGLNIPTYITLFIYGYSDIWELDAVVDPENSPIEFESSAPIINQ